jgi:hypothetical protein
VSTSTCRLRPSTCLCASKLPPPCFGGFDRLTVDDAGAGLALLAGRDPDIITEEIMYHLLGPVLTPLAKVVIDNSPRRLVIG